MLFDNIKNAQFDKNPIVPTPYEIDIIPVYNPINSSEQFMIFNDFLLIEKNCANVLLKDIEDIPYYTLTCTFAGNNLVIFHYPIDKYKNILNNKNYICVISTIDDNNNFKNEYLLKYKDKKYYKYHIEEIKKDLSGYIGAIKFMNNTAPIVINDYIEIGVFIKLCDNMPISSFNNIENDFKNDNSKVNIQNYTKNYFITKEGEKIISVNFISMNCSDISYYSLVCKESDLFLTLEERLYGDFPQLRGKALFMCKTKQIDRNKTLQENNIKSNSLINVFKIEQKI